MIVGLGITTEKVGTGFAVGLSVTEGLVVGVGVGVGVGCGVTLGGITGTDGATVGCVGTGTMV